MNLARSIFKAYDIRGIVDQTLTEDAVEAIGRALGSSAREKQVNEIVIGYDGRHSGPRLAAKLAHGIRTTGIGVIEIGMVATPLAYFATHALGTGSCVMVTGSHNPPEYNGLKMMLAGETLHGEAITALYERIVAGKLATAATPGGVRAGDVRETYMSRVASDITLKRKMKIALDCGNGVAGAFAPELLRRLGVDVIELYCEVDGSFPNHHPDPAQPHNLQDLIATLKTSGAELGLAFDGDGDRLGVVTPRGDIIYPDRQLMLYAADVLSRNPGATILYDVKCTRNLKGFIAQHGGVPLMGKTGHSLIKAKMKETGALLAGEMSGHIFFKERWYGFDDALYVAARLLEILSAHANPGAVLEALPDAVSTPELHLECAEGEHHALIARLQQEAPFASAPGVTDVITIDGLRVEYADGFGLMRASNTTPIIVLRFEAESTAALARIQAAFRPVLLSAKPDAALPF